MPEVLAPVPDYILQKVVENPTRLDFYFALRYRRPISNGELTHILAYVTYQDFSELVLQSGGIQPETQWGSTNW